MARGSPGTIRVARRPPPCFYLLVSQSPPLLRGKPPAAAKAWPSFAPGRAPPASRRGLPNTAKPPTSAPPPARISRSTARDMHPLDTALRQRAAPPEWSCSFPAAPATLPQQPAPSVSLL